MPQAIRAVLIDPYAENEADRVRDIVIDGPDRLKDYYNLIGHDCSLVEATYPAAVGGECVYVDEEGLWQQYAGFQFRSHPQPLMGRAIIIGTNDRGDTVSTNWTAEEVRPNIIGWAMDFDRLEREMQS